MSATKSSSANATASGPYPEVSPQPKFPEIEERILKYWREQNTFKKSVENRQSGKDGAREFVFYDGPPFANGLPHYGHLLTGYVKDVVPRFQSMRGRRVERRFGWDCHGLPAEMEVEKELKISGRQQIMEYGIGKFNSHCQQSVLKYTNEWESYVTRQARWVDFKNPYKTMDLSYMESVMWAFKQLWDKGLIYEAFRVMPYSWAAETPLSNFETRMDNSYRPRQDPAVTVALSLDKAAGATLSESALPRKILVWTTTPWTLPSNLAVAVGADIDYAIIEHDDAHYIIGVAALPKYEAQLKDAKQVGSVKGRDLVGCTYQPLFPYFKTHANSFRVLAGDFVNTDEGTGIVHMAPGFGEDDQRLCEASGISIVCPVDEKGRFTAEISDYAGQQVFDANKNIIRDLKARGVLLRHDSYTHNYPHCWRTDTPIIYRALNSWYVRVTDFKDRMVELNQQINWIPEHIRDGSFGRWLENARDWSISRNRFWGSPIPVWRSDDPKYPRTDVYGSLDELAADFGVRPTDLHRPYIDNLVRPNPDDPTGKSMMRRVEEVLDCWFESGSMPYAQVHYPFEKKEWFENHFPADFIVEYIAQTRGWFYTLMVLGTALFDKPPFLNCMCHGVVLDENGQKLSKRLRNYPSPEEVFGTLGSDALRWFLMSSSILRGGDLEIDRDGKAIAEAVRTVINPIWNAYYFFTLYANSDGIRAEFDTTSQDLLDRYILSKTSQLVRGCETALESYDIPGACQQLTLFLEALNNWYIRRSRERFWKHDKDADKQAAYNTLYTVLHTLVRSAAPLLPLISEEVYRGLTGAESVHLTDWPDAGTLPTDNDLVRAMDRVREVCSVGLALREQHGLRTRLPLAAVTVAGADVAQSAPYAALIRDELNVKEVHFADKIEEFATFQLSVNSRQLGPKLGGKIKDVLNAAKAGQWRQLSPGVVEVAGERLSGDDFVLKLSAKSGVASQSLPANDAVVVLDTAVTPALAEEGLARDLVRLVQQARKEAGFHVSDHIMLSVDVGGGLRAALEKHRSYISEQVLARELKFAATEGGDAFRQAGKLDDKEISFSVRRV